MEKRASILKQRPSNWSFFEVSLNLTRGQGYGSVGRSVSERRFPTYHSREAARRAKTKTPQHAW